MLQRILFNALFVATSFGNTSFVVTNIVEHIICVFNVIVEYVICCSNVITQQVICCNEYCSTSFVVTNIVQRDYSTYHLFQRHCSTYHLCSNVICQHVICCNEHCSPHKQTSKSKSVRFTSLAHFYKQVGFF